MTTTDEKHKIDVDQSGESCKISHPDQTFPIFGEVRCVEKLWKSPRGECSQMGSVWQQLAKLWPSCSLREEEWIYSGHYRGKETCESFTFTSWALFPLNEYSMPKSVHVCSEWVLRGKAKTTVELVCWCWVSMRQGELAGVQASREGAAVRWVLTSASGAKKCDQQVKSRTDRPSIVAVSSSRFSLSGFQTEAT
ncbi:hypothetical protein NQZ68_025818 [Dissostichus eleginoides]|nr:hypothetical protein NQZ68_025818 [Dissostichus eleginoides]